VRERKVSIDKRKKRREGKTHEAPKIQVDPSPMSAPTIEPTQRSEPLETRPRLSESLEMAHCSPSPKEKEREGGVSQGKV
jgi:hypothetical protein